MKNLLLIGPGSSILDFKPPSNDCTILSFAGTFDWFITHNIAPKYWTFLDPNSVMSIQDKIPSHFLPKLKSTTTLVYSDFQGTNKFYENGFSTSRGSLWNNDVFRKKILSEFTKKFKNTMLIPSKVSKNKLLTNSDSHCNVTHGPRPNPCKFSCFVLPMVFYLFPQIKNIDVIGFGDYSYPRAYSNSCADYNQYIQSFQIISPQIKQYLENNNICINFLNKNSYYKELKIKKNEKNNILYTK
jgi:hypothetical protein